MKVGIMVRLTKKVRQQLLDQNDGFQATTDYSAKNFSETKEYTVTNGELHIRSRGKTSWADSRFDNETVADEEQTRRLLHKNLDDLNTDGIDS